MSSTTLYNRNEAQVSVKGDDGNSYWIPPNQRTTIPTTVSNNPLPSGVKKTSSPSQS